MFTRLMFALVMTSCLTFAAADTARKAVIRTALTDANSDLDAAVREEKYTAMQESALAFYRATDHLYFQDIQNGVIAIPKEWPGTDNISIWLSADFHFQNVGFFDNNKGDITFDLNDYDESYVAPFYFDTIRFMASLHLVRPALAFSLSQSQVQSINLDIFMAQYQNTLKDVNGNDTETKVVIDEDLVGKGFVGKRFGKLAKRTVAERLDKWSTADGDTRTFNIDANPKLAKLEASEQADLKSGYAVYLKQIADFVDQKPKWYFTVIDQARRLHSGLGSLGTRKYYVLIEGPTQGSDDDIILEVKAESRPSMLDWILKDKLPVYKRQFSDEGMRAFTASKALLNKVDNHYGAMPLGTDRALVRRISPYKYGYEADNFKSPDDLEDFVKWAARALAYAHARSDKDYKTTYVDYNFEAGYLAAISAWSKAKTSMSNLAATYADQVNQDYELFMQLRKAGEL